MKFPDSEYIQLEIPNSSVLDSAEQFYNGAKKLKDLPPMSGILLPKITNAALALELYAKCLNAWNIIPDYQSYGGAVFGGEIKGKPKKTGHRISEILKDYDQDLIVEINRLFKEEHIPLCFTDLVSRLKVYDNLFMQVRYSYENDCLDSLNLADLWEVIDIMREIVFNITPICKHLK